MLASGTHPPVARNATRVSAGNASAALRQAWPKAYARLYRIRGGVKTFKKTGMILTSGKSGSIRIQGMSTLLPYSTGPVREQSNPCPTSDAISASAIAVELENVQSFLMCSGSAHWGAKLCESATGTAIVGMWLR